MVAMKSLLTIGALFLTSCGAMERFSTNMTGNLSYKCSRWGVIYVQSDSGLALGVDKDGVSHE